MFYIFNSLAIFHIIYFFPNFFALGFTKKGGNRHLYINIFSINMITFANMCNRHPLLVLIATPTIMSVISPSSFYWCWCDLLLVLICNLTYDQQVKLKCMSIFTPWLLVWQSKYIICFMFLFLFSLAIH